MGDYAEERAVMMGTDIEVPTDSKETPIETELDKAISMLKAEYARAKELKFVQKPLAYALYQTWKKVDNWRVVRKNG